MPNKAQDPRMLFHSLLIQNCVLFLLIILFGLQLELYLCESLLNRLRNRMKEISCLLSSKFLQHHRQFVFFSWKLFFLKIEGKSVQIFFFVVVFPTQFYEHNSSSHSILFYSMLICEKLYRILVVLRVKNFSFKRDRKKERAKRKDTETKSEGRLMRRFCPGMLSCSPSKDGEKGKVFFTAEKFSSIEGFCYVLAFERRDGGREPAVRTKCKPLWLRWVLAKGFKGNHSVVLVCSFASMLLLSTPKNGNRKTWREKEVLEKSVLPLVVFG